MDPYATHLPLLRALGRFVPIRRVLEFGCGLFSTPEFLKRESFPALERLDSYEKDALWARRVLAHVDNPRGRLALTILADITCAEVMAGLSLDAYDLILIDDGPSVRERVATIRAVVAQNPHNIVVIHDYEVPGYRQAAGDWDGIWVYEHRLPGRAIQTGLYYANSPLAGAVAHAIAHLEGGGW